MEKTLRDLVARAKTEEAIRLLLQHTATDNDFNNRAIQLSARFQTYKKNLLGNLRDDSVLGVELANINHSLLAMVEEWETRQDKPKEDTPVPWLKWLGFVVAVCAFLASVAELSGYSLRDLFSKKDEPTVLQKDTTQEAKQPLVTLPKEESPTQQQRAAPATFTQAPTTTTTMAARLSISVKTDHSAAPTQSYREGEHIRLFVKATQPCYVRALYKLADGQVVLLAEDKQVLEKDLPSWVELGYGFDVTEPFGAEELHVFAQSQPFDDLKTIEQDGYRFVPSGLPAALSATRRGLKPKAAHAECRININTKSR